jgi:hypothetical protein
MNLAPFMCAPLLLWVLVWFEFAAVFAAFLARAGETARQSSLDSSNAVAELGSGPEHLKKQTHIVLTTNLPPPSERSFDTKQPARTFDWNSHWAGWNGWCYELTRKTSLGDVLALRTNRYGFQLAETKMAGKLGAKFAVGAVGYMRGAEFGGFDAGVELRRARIYAKGDCLLLVPVSYVLEIGYIPGSFYIENSYLEFHNLGFLDFLGGLKCGQFKVPMSLENYQSSRDIMFMEPASPVLALAPGINTGVQVGQPVLDERMTWALGLFTKGAAGGSDFGEATTGLGRVAGRWTLAGRWTT